MVWVPMKHFESSSPPFTQNETVHLVNDDGGSCTIGVGFPLDGKWSGTFGRRKEAAHTSPHSVPTFTGIRENVQLWLQREELYRNFSTREVVRANKRNAACAVWEEERNQWYLQFQRLAVTQSSGNFDLVSSRSSEISIPFSLVLLVLNHFPKLDWF